MYYVNGVTSGTCPLAQNLMYGGTLFVIPNQSYNRVVQIYINPSRGSFTRFNYAGEWQPWKVIYDESILTNSSILSPLASALGGFGNNALLINSNANLNNYSETGMVYYTSASTPGNMAPWTGYTTYVFVIKFNDMESVQFAFNAMGGQFAMRTYNGNWNSWYKITLTT